MNLYSVKPFLVYMFIFRQGDTQNRAKYRRNAVRFPRSISHRNAESHQFSPCSIKNDLRISPVSDSFDSGLGFTGRIFTSAYRVRAVMSDWAVLGAIWGKFSIVTIPISITYLYFSYFHTNHIHQSLTQSEQFRGICTDSHANFRRLSRSTGYGDAWIRGAKMASIARY